MLLDLSRVPCAAEGSAPPSLLPLVGWLSGAGVLDEFESPVHPPIKSDASMHKYRLSAIVRCMAVSPQLVRQTHI
jgi:hypothetical protein